MKDDLKERLDEILTEILEDKDAQDYDDAFLILMTLLPLIDSSNVTININLGGE